jgi:uncharacterized coiled-coil protein SlyX
VTYADAAHNAALMTGLERAQEARIEELERRLAEMERLYDKAAADLIEALDVASAYRATASTLHQEVERRNGVERRHDPLDANGIPSGDPCIGRRSAIEDRRKSWPR